MILLLLCSWTVLPALAAPDEEPQDGFTQEEGIAPLTDDIEEEEEPEEDEEEVFQGDPIEPDDSDEEFDESVPNEPTQGVFCGVPLYLQTDYPHVPYNGSTLSRAGCSMAVVAMVASYLRGEEILPDALAARFGKADGSNVQRMEAASICLDLKFHKAGSLYSAIQALKAGQVAIVMVNSRSDFTNSQHLIVLTGITDDGRIMVHDPNGNNYDKDELRDGFRYGFNQSDIAIGFSGAWIYEGYEPMELGEGRFSDVKMTEDERDLLARLIWREARGECFEGQIAIADIVLNRMTSPQFPTNTVSGTIWAEGQFRTQKFLEDTTADELQFKAIDMALNGYNVLPEDVFFFGNYAVNNNIWGQIGKHVFCGPFQNYESSES